jgi:hypothetical protein
MTSAAMSKTELIKKKRPLQSLGRSRENHPHRKTGVELGGLGRRSKESSSYAFETTRVTEQTQA